jgi:hypothetical protein
MKHFYGCDMKYIVSFVHNHVFESCSFHIITCYLLVGVSSLLSSVLQSDALCYYSIEERCVDAYAVQVVSNVHILNECFLLSVLIC